MGIVTKFTIEKIRRSSTMAPAAKINLKDKVEDGEIDLSMADLQDVPVKEIAAITKAHSLDLSNNRLTVLPKNFVTLTHLTKLDLSRNQLNELPENFGDLCKLKHLDLYKNQLQHLPLSFSKLKALKWLDLKDNPLVPAVAKVAGLCLDSKQCQTSAKNVVSFYSELQNKVDQEREIREAQRQKDLLANLLANEQLKQQQAKKVKKDKKEKVKEKSSDEVINESVKSDTSRERNGKDVKVKVVQSKHCLFKLLCMLVLSASITMFVLTAAKIKHTDVIQSTVVRFWNGAMASLPPSFQPTGHQIGTFIYDVHQKTGVAVEILTDRIIELQKNDAINNILNFFKNLINTSVEKLHNLYKSTIAAVVTSEGAKDKTI